MEYLLYVFSTHENQENFVKILAEQIMIITNSEDVKYYFGPQSVIYKFSSNEEYEVIGECIKSIFGEAGIVFFLHIFDNTKVHYWLDSDINEYLFGEKNKFQPTEEQKVEFQKTFFKELTEDNFEIINQDETLFCEDNDIIKITKKKKIPTLNDLLDKINEKGLTSLTEKEIKLLNNYSK